MKLPRREFLHLAAALGALPAVSHSAKAQTYPSRPIRLIIGFTPGAASDIIGRVFAKGAGPVLGQEVVVENKLSWSSIRRPTCTASRTLLL